MKQKSKKSLSCFSALLVGAAFVPASFAFNTVTVNAADQQQTGNKDGYDFELWNQNGQGSVNMEVGSSGAFSCSWSNIENCLFRTGKKLGSTQSWQSYGGISIDYDVDYKPEGNSYMCVYGWTEDPTVEYYIVEAWGDWRPPGQTGGKGTVSADGKTYDIYTSTRVNQPSIHGTETFEQYWSVNQTNPAQVYQMKNLKGTISVSTHFEQWEKAGMKMGKMYEVALNIEGYRSNGSANVKMNNLTIGGGGGQQQNNSWDQQQNNSWDQNWNQNNDWNNQNNSWDQNWNQNNDWNNQNNSWDQNWNQNNSWDQNWNQNNDWNNQNWNQDWNNQNNNWDQNQWNQNQDWNNQNNNWDQNQWNQDWNNQNNNWDQNQWNQDWNNQNNNWDQNQWNQDWNNQNNNWDQNQWNQNQDWNNQNNNWDQNQWNQDWNNQNNNWDQNQWNQDWNNQNNNWDQNQWNQDWNNQNNNWDQNQWNQNNNWDQNQWNQNNDWNNQNNNNQGGNASTSQGNAPAQISLEATNSGFNINLKNNQGISALQADIQISGGSFDKVGTGTFGGSWSNTSNVIQYLSNNGRNTNSGDGTLGSVSLGAGTYTITLSNIMVTSYSESQGLHNKTKYNDKITITVNVGQNGWGYVGSTSWDSEDENEVSTYYTGAQNDIDYITDMIADFYA